MTDDPLTDLRSAMIAINEARRTLYVNPADEPHAERTTIDLGVAGLITIITCDELPAGTMYVIDEQAMQAQLREIMQRPIKFDWRV